jgi:outer membrane protein assembly factor BamB
MRIARALMLVALAALTGCAGTGAFGLTSDDNNPERLAQAFARREPPRENAPMNSLGKPLAFLVARANKQKNIPQQLIAFDLEAKQELWRVETGVRSRVEVSREIVAFVDGQGKLVARSIATGEELWSADVGVFLGAAVDEERVFYVSEDKTGRKPVWWLVALDARTGAQLWRADAPGRLGAPSAQGGLVFSPFLRQWLAILDARTGKQLARIRGIDEEISFVRTTSKNVYFGSKAGVFLLDERAASGLRAQSTYGQAALPDEFVRSHYHWDAFDQVQTGYSAYDRNRLLWRGQPRGEELSFADGLIVVHTYRFFFAFDTSSGTLRWAYNHPRYDAVGTAHVGASIAFASGLGELGALEPGTGRRIYSAKVPDQLIGVTFDADGWAPGEDGAPTSTVTTLASIARDPDARFNEIKRFAVAALAALPGADVTRDLLDLIQNERTPKQLYDKAVEVLIERKEPAGLVHLLTVLQLPYDYIAGSRPRGVGVVAQAVGALGASSTLDPAQRGAAIEALLANLNAPETPASDLALVIKALGAMGGGVEIAPLRDFVLAYHADPAFSSQIAPMSAAIDILLGQGGTPERALVAFVADDPRSQASIAEHARRALEQSGQPALARGVPASEAATDAPQGGGGSDAKGSGGQ